MDPRTLLRIAVRVAGVIRVSREMVVLELPYAKGLDPYKLGEGLSAKSRKLLNDIVRDYGGGKFKLLEDRLRFEVPAESARDVRADLEDWARLDKKGGKLFQMPRMRQLPKAPLQVRYPGEQPWTEDFEERSWSEEPAEDAPKAKAEEAPPKPKERGVRDERPKVPGRGEEPVEGGKEPKGRPKKGPGFRVEVPINMRGFVNRLEDNPHIKKLLERHKGKPVGGGEGLILEFPDSGKRSEILDEVADAIKESSYLREVLEARPTA